MLGVRCLIGGGLLVVAVAICAAQSGNSSPPNASNAVPNASELHSRGDNPHPVRLVRPAAGPLSEMAKLGKLIFFDKHLSSSGQISCAFCHSPQHAYGPPGDLPAMRGGPHLSRQGDRAVPSLMYLESQPSFSIGPDNEENETVSIGQMVVLSGTAARAQKIAAPAPQSANNLVPQGGLFWDGRADTLQNQALSPLLDPREMDGGSVEAVAAKLRQAPYARRLMRLVGASLLEDPGFTVAEALFAVARYQIEDASFHPYTSKFDYWLEGKARFTPGELRGYVLFNDPAKANCAGCHVDRPSRDGLPPLFTDHQFEALGVPRNEALTLNRDPDYFDLGICGPYRTDMALDTQYCGMFLTPTLRNVSTRHVFFHNGIYHTLQQVLDFYDFRDTEPEKIYPRGADGLVRKFDDLPQPYRANVDVADPPFDRKPGDRLAMTPQDETDIIAFLNTLDDGYRER
jgi:cytochrome c peroxidase